MLLITVAVTATVLASTYGMHAACQTHILNFCANSLTPCISSQLHVSQAWEELQCFSLKENAEAQEVRLPVPGDTARTDLGPARNSQHCTWTVL